ncbi:MAG: ABC transporter permease [Candidatus Merdivicinus sp.]
MSHSRAKGGNIITRYWKNRYLTIMLIPALIYFAVFKYAPIYGLTIAFKDYKLLDGIMGSPWIGFEVFQELFAKDTFWLVMRNTIVIGIYQLIFGFPAPIIFALLLNEITRMRFKKVVQTISYLPHFVSWVVLGGLFMQFLSPSTGPINIIISSLGGTPIYFLADKSWFRTVLVVTNIWKSIGWGSIIYLAALSGIDTTLYEAADIDGASRFRKMISITLPSIMPMITIMLIMQSGKLLNDNFDQIFNLYNPAVYEVADVLSTYTYREGIGNLQYSYATAVELFKNVISFALVIVTNQICKRTSEYGIW